MTLKSYCHSPKLTSTVSLTLSGEKEGVCTSLLQGPLLAVSPSGLSAPFAVGEPEGQKAGLGFKGCHRCGWKWPGALLAET